MRKVVLEVAREICPERAYNVSFGVFSMPLFVENFNNKFKTELSKDEYDKKQKLINKSKKYLVDFGALSWLAFLPDELLSLPEDDVRKYLNSTALCCLRDRWGNGKVYSLCKVCANKKILNELPDNVKNSINHKNNWEFAECRCSMCKISYPLYEIGFCPKCYKSFCKECYESDKISKSGCPNCKFKCEDIHKCSKNNPFRFEVRVIQLPSEYLSTALNLDLCCAQLGAHKKFELSKRGKK